MELVLLSSLRRLTVHNAENNKPTDGEGSSTLWDVLQWCEKGSEKKAQILCKSIQIIWKQGEGGGREINGNQRESVKWTV